MVAKLILLLLALTSLSYGGNIESSNSDSKHIEYGKKHTCVLQIKGFSSDDNNSPFSASCVAIAPYYVLTAAHVVENTIVQLVITEHNKVCIAEKVIIPKEYKHDKKSKNDIAIIQLRNNLSLDFYPELYNDNDEIGKVCSIAGYGCPGTFDKGFTKSKHDHKKRAGSNHIENIFNDVLICYIDKNKTTELEFSITPGDSGGGLFINQKLAGINSYIDAKDGKADGSYGDNTAHTRISIFKNWIEKTINRLEMDK